MWLQNEPVCLRDIEQGGSTGMTRRLKQLAEIFFDKETIANERLIKLKA
jgi:hypothetical protein